MLCGEEHICRGQRSNSGVTLQVCPICFLSQGPSLVLELTGEARLAGKPRGPLVFLFQGWPHMYFTMPGLYVTARIELRSSGLHSTPPTPELPPQLQTRVLLHRKVTESLLHCGTV